MCRKATQMADVDCGDRPRPAEHLPTSRLYGCPFVTFDVTDWPLVHAFVNGRTEDGLPQHFTLDDIVKAGWCTRYVMHVAKYGSDGRGSIPTVPHMLEEDEILDQHLPTQLRNLPCGPICIILNLNRAFVPPPQLFGPVVELVRDVKRMMQDCVDYSVVVVPVTFKAVVQAIVAAAGGVPSVFVSSMNDAYSALASSVLKDEET